MAGSFTGFCITLLNPRKALWPKADYIVGNPPFVGAKPMRTLLGDGYVDAIQTAWTDVPQATDLVLRWWHRAAGLAARKDLRAFGFITSSTIRQTYNRRVINAFLEAETLPVSIVFAVPDHPWVDTADGAAVRIAMTVGTAGSHNGTLVTVTRERDRGKASDEDMVLELAESKGRIHSNLKIGVDLTKAVSLRSNKGLCAVGFKTIGKHFQVNAEKAKALGLSRIPEIEKHIRPYINGRDLAGSRRGLYVLDFFDCTADEVRASFPDAYQHLLDYVKHEREQNRNPIFRSRWWVIGHPRPVFRRFSKGLKFYIATIESAKHRFFTALPAVDAPDSTLVTFGLNDSYFLGVLSSRLHVTWALGVGGRLGVGNDPRYNKTRCFETFPFPTPSESQTDKIRNLAEQIDGHRKRQMANFPGLVLTNIYNVVEKVRSGEPLSAKEKTIHQQGLVSVLCDLHDELDHAVFAAYGWDDLAAKLVGKPGATMPLPDKPDEQAEAEEELLFRLVALNAIRAAEEAKGQVRWLRPDYQNPAHGVGAVSPAEQVEIEVGEEEVVAPEAKAKPAGKAAWPKSMREQVAAVLASLQGGARSAEAIATQFKRSPTVSVQSVLGALEELGRVQQDAGLFRLTAGGM